MFWIHASNAPRFEQSFRDIADCIKIFGRHNPQANIFQVVHDWLRDERKGQWIIILDNADDASFLIDAHRTDHDSMPRNSSSGGESRPLVRYLPQCKNGSILITTRSRNAALELVEADNIIAINPMDRASALALFEKKLGKQNDIDSISELATALDCIPLPIGQAASYISQWAPRLSVRQYLEDFRKSDHKRATLLSFEGGQLRRDREAKNSVIATWQISFEHVLRTRPSAADLLSLMSFFDPQGIPESLIRNRSERAQQDQKVNIVDGRVDEDSNDDHGGEVNDEDDDVSSQSSVTDEYEYQDDISILRHYSFVSANTDGKTFEMHRLVQLATREWLSARGQQNRWKRQFIRNLYVKFPVRVYENWAICQALFPHVKSAAAQKPEEQESLTTWASLLYNAAWYAWRIGNGPEAEDMSVQAMNVRKKILGKDHVDTLSSMAMAGLAYNLQGRWNAAEEMFVQVVETRKRVLGAGHPDTLISMGNLAVTYREQRRWKEAEELEVTVIETRRRMLGEEHPYTLISMGNLAATYREQRRWKEAEELEVTVIETRRRILGEEHPDTLNSMANLAAIYQNQGRWDEAEKLQVQVMETTKRMLGEEHPDTLTSMVNLAAIYQNQGRWAEAEKLQVMETTKRVLGEEHPSTLTSMANLAVTCWNQGRRNEAIEILKEVVDLRTKTIGVNHPDTIGALKRLDRWSSTS